MGWTDDVAEWFARRPIWPQRGTVWTTTAPPSALLARITTERPRESEYVVDPDALGKITEASAGSFVSGAVPGSGSGSR